MEIVADDKKLHLVQSLMFEMLCDIDDFCKKHNIRYLLSGGTCLGAVRHNGFIPWDDDSDIMMPRKDYMKFFKLFGKYYADKYGASCCEMDREWIRPSGRIWNKATSVIYKNVEDREMGVFVDIFPIDGLPDGKLSRKIFYRKLMVLEVLRSSSIRKAFIKNEKYRTLKRFIGFFAKHLNPRGLALRMNLIGRKYDFDTCKLVGASMAGVHWDQETIVREGMASAAYLPFNGRKFPVPLYYDTYLSNLYGDYMTLPDEEHRETHCQLYELKYDPEKIHLD